jgi:hypothetical protein
LWKQKNFIFWHFLNIQFPINCLLLFDSHYKKKLEILYIFYFMIGRFVSIFAWWYLPRHSCEGFPDAMHRKDRVSTVSSLFIISVCDFFCQYMW